MSLMTPHEYRLREDLKFSKSSYTPWGRMVIRAIDFDDCVAMVQAFETRRRLQEQFEEMNEDGAIEICVLKTQGDMILDKSLMELGGKGLFTKELDTALLSNEVDICVHSMKTFDEST